MARPRSSRLASVTCGGALLALGVFAPSISAQKAVTKPSYANTVAPVTKQYCVPCHSGQDPVAGLDLSRYKTDADVLGAPEVWAKVAKNIASGSMPPKGRPFPSGAQR